MTIPPLLRTIAIYIAKTLWFQFRFRVIIYVAETVYSAFSGRNINVNAYFWYVLRFYYSWISGIAGVLWREMRGVLAQWGRAGEGGLGNGE